MSVCGPVEKPSLSVKNEEARLSPAEEDDAISQYTPVKKYKTKGKKG
jgi:hypothetical protein